MLLVEGRAVGEQFEAARDKLRAVSVVSNGEI